LTNLTSSTSVKWNFFLPVLVCVAEDIRGLRDDVLLVEAHRAHTVVALGARNSRACACAGRGRRNIAWGEGDERRRPEKKISSEVRKGPTIFLLDDGIRCLD
jgi:hypothetical protein